MSLIRADPEEMEKTKMEKRVFLIVLDSFGIGAEPDAAAFGDEGTNTLGAIAKHPNFSCRAWARIPPSATGRSPVW